MNEKRLLILYGSQTGTAQDVAEQIWRESKHLGFSGPVMAVNEYQIADLPAEKFVVFVVATTGNGDEPDNMKEFWKLIRRRSIPPDTFANLQYACLGLGDSSYEKFNYAAKKLNKRLLQLSAKELVPLGLCDDQHDYGLSGVSLDWISKLWRAIGDQVSIDLNRLHTKINSIFKYRISMRKNEGLCNAWIPVKKLWPDQGVYHKFEVLINQRTTSGDHFQDVRYLRFRFPKEENVSWQPGDILQVRPSNSDEDIAAFFSLSQEHNWGLVSEATVDITSVYPDVPLPSVYAQPITIKQLVQRVWDLSCKPRQRVFELLALNCDDEMERDKLIEFTTAEGLDDLINYVNRPRRSLLEVLYDFPKATAKLTLPLMCEMFPTIQARSFSIASVPQSDSLDLLVAVVKYKTKLSKPRLGLCSNWLKGLKPGDHIYGTIKKGTMALPPKDLFPKTPIIMIGPGTGIAPFRSILQSLEYGETSSKTSEHNRNNRACIAVFFGCRYKGKDFHFQSDLEAWHQSRFIRLFTAFSRDQNDKIYVQHLIEAEKELIKTLILNDNGIILVAGSSNNMPRAVREAFAKALDVDASFVEELIKSRRYQEETWS